MHEEQNRLKDPSWKKWGPYVSDRQWGTVREDYSANQDPWNYTTHDMARSYAYRWGEEGIAGISDEKQTLCFALALWNKKDPILKERYFGLNNAEGNHGEDVKELYYYLDSTPTHSYMKTLYKYPQTAYPYQQLIEENHRRDRTMAEYELIDTGIFNNNAYFDVFTEYAKSSTDDILVRITIHNRGQESASLSVLPTLWFRNSWSWGYEPDRPHLGKDSGNTIRIRHNTLANKYWLYEGNPQPLFCDNDTNVKRLYQQDGQGRYYKDGINDHVISGANSVNPEMYGTKAALHYDLSLEPGGSYTIRLQLTTERQPFTNFDATFQSRLQEADDFYAQLQKDITDEDLRSIQRQALSGMLWNKQFYYYNLHKWIQGDPAMPPPPPGRDKGRNHHWLHLHNSDIISMPDKWEFPWYASWDLAFHCQTLAMVDVEFAKQQLLLLTKEWYMHPSGKLPAYEWEFDDTNPPVMAGAAWEIYRMEIEAGGQGDRRFLEAIFHKLVINFTWWVNRKDEDGLNIFEGGFLGMDNIGVFDRNTPLPPNAVLEQADGTGWMAASALNMLTIALELARENDVYEAMAVKFFEHFLYIAGAIAGIGGQSVALWDEQDEFFYDQLRYEGLPPVTLRTRSLANVVPLFAVQVLDSNMLKQLPEFTTHMNWFLRHRPDLASMVSRWYEEGNNEKHLLSLLRGHRMKRILKRVLDETEFLSDHGVRSLSKYHNDHPYAYNFNGQDMSIRYIPGESDSGMFGGNSNWRGPVWMPINFLIICSLQRFQDYYSDDFKVEYPTNSGNYLTLREIADALSSRLIRIFKKDEHGRRPVFNSYDKLQQDPHFRDYILFHEYYHGDDGHGIGASHQTGWSGLIANLIKRSYKQ
ncbi:Glycosyl hydrolase family 63 C-terminal domain-containing protein [Chitinophaga costaii]|uniref:Glycosyl hydrolase family 63 C-terminal domain-containing protein n=1 Tax=Chitinophaga costaii TaxID=1335309 RepID=A0A1C4FFB5_9BACT|nr:glucosidase [Chitinophaga costaii]PUZ20120.1 glucosidase [Chitinophaga costaii]SCC54600.1 Glycosyl hydrolase family 63 C-terminal domain-containing protein [Chitinophaga costaii]